MRQLEGAAGETYLLNLKKRALERIKSYFFLALKKQNDNTKMMKIL